MFVSIILFLCIGICTITDILRKTVDIRVLLAFSFNSCSLLLILKKIIILKVLWQASVLAF